MFIPFQLQTLHISKTIVLIVLTTMYIELVLVNTTDMVGSTFYHFALNPVLPPQSRQLVGGYSVPSVSHLMVVLLFFPDVSNCADVRLTLVHV
jgi:hypothetical protein